MCMQMPMGLEHELGGLVDLVTRTAWHFEGANGERPVAVPVPAVLQEEMEAKVC